MSHYTKLRNWEMLNQVNCLSKQQVILPLLTFHSNTPLLRPMVMHVTMTPMKIAIRQNLNFFEQWFFLWGSCNVLHCSTSFDVSSISVIYLDWCKLSWNKTKSYQKYLRIKYYKLPLRTISMTFLTKKCFSFIVWIKRGISRS